MGYKGYPNLINSFDPLIMFGNGDSMSLGFIGWSKLQKEYLLRAFLLGIDYAPIIGFFVGEP